jgi:hypothetical protein
MLAAVDSENANGSSRRQFKIVSRCGKAMAFE